MPSSRRGSMGYTPDCKDIWVTWVATVGILINSNYPDPDRSGDGVLFSIDFLFLCKQDYEKMARPICMKFSGKVRSDHGTT